MGHYMFGIYENRAGYIKTGNTMIIIFPYLVSYCISPCLFPHLAIRKI